ncbi:hypothetical protein C2L64_51710 [Paraburkholderia hospita]|uniref:Uncharacterized protein n=1 Tax=Paraburkholderia hospita TaxID=169430 RepID=A0AAN1JN94_9BURK|nr:hypothetical protein C2L64_51710 [Paraburkholderia hospita]
MLLCRLRPCPTQLLGRYCGASQSRRPSLLLIFPPRGKPVGDWLVHLAREMGLCGATLIAGAESIGHHHSGARMRRTRIARAGMRCGSAPGCQTTCTFSSSM